MKGPTRYQQQGSFYLLLVIFKAGVITALSLKRKSFSSPSCVGVCLPNNNNSNNNSNKTKRINYYVIGTSHFSCNSCNEVSALINLVQPDGVVIELDPERVLRLTLDHASNNQKVNVDDNKKQQHQQKQRQKQQNRLFGADFLSAIETSKFLDIPIFLGDESPIETRARLFSLFDIDSYKPDKLLSTLASLFRRRSRNKDSTNNQTEILFVDVLGTFLDDPRKLLPLVTTLSLPALALALTIIVDGSTTSAAAAAASAASIVTTAEAATTIVTDTITNNDFLFNFNNNSNNGFFFEMLPTILSLLISFFASCKVYNNLIADRDIVVASNVQRAAETIALLQSNQLIRKRWTFPAYASATNNGTYEEVVTEEEVNDKSTTPSVSATIPLFTLKTPLERNAVRNLNLFEPRWLKMIDRLLLSKSQQQQRNNVEESSSSVCVDAFTDTDTTTATTTTTTTIENNSSVEQQTIGCVICENKFYSAVNIADAAEGNEKSLPFVEGRYADVIFRRRGRFGELINVTEGNRPSGDRKVSARIVGRESFEFPSSKGNDRDDDRISVVPEGYLTASNLRPMMNNKDQKIFKNDNNGNDNIGECDDIDTDDNEINIVVVVGLLHANGVLECLSRNHLS